MVNETCQTCNRKTYDNKKYSFKMYFSKYVFSNMHMVLQKVMKIIFRLYIYFQINIKSCFLWFFFRNVLKILEDEQGDMQKILIGMSKNVYNEMVKEMNITAFQEKPSQQ